MSHLGTLCDAVRLAVRRVFRVLVASPTKLGQYTKKALALLRELLPRLEPVSKGIFWVLAAILSAVLLLDVIRDLSWDVVYVDTFDLPEEAIRSGVSPKQFTDRAVRAAQSLVDARRIQTTPAFTAVERKKRDSLGPNACSIRLAPLPQLLAELEREIKSRAVSDWRRTDLVLPQAGVPVRAFSDAVRRAFDMPALRLGGALVKTDPERYVVQVHAQFGPARAQVSEVEAKTIADAEKRAGILILKYANPAVYASTVHVNDPQGVGEALLTAPEHWGELRSRSLPYTIIGYFSLINQELAAGTSNLVVAAHYFDKALEKDKGDVLAEIGAIVARTRISDKLAARVKRVASPDGAGNDSRREALERLETLGSTDRFAAYAYAAKATLHGEVGEHVQAAVAWGKARAAAPSNAEFALAQAVSLIRASKLEEAESVLNRRSSTDQPADVITWQQVLGRALLVAERGNLDVGDRMASALILLGEPCAVADWADYLRARALNEKDPTRASWIRKRANARFATAEQEGVKGFHFYNLWGGLLIEMGRYDEAIEKLQEARYFYGDEAWALLNIGQILNRQGRPKEAEARFRESLGKAVVPLAVEGYLSAIYNQKDYRRFLDEYNKWESDVSLVQNQRFAAAVGVAHCEIGERTDAAAALQRMGSTQGDAEVESLRSYLRSCIDAKKPAGGPGTLAPPSSP